MYTRPCKARGDKWSLRMLVRCCDIVSPTYHAWYVAIARDVANISVLGIGKDLLRKWFEGRDVSILLGVEQGHFDYHTSHCEQEDDQKPDHHGNVILILKKDFI